MRVWQSRCDGDLKAEALIVSAKDGVDSGGLEQKDGAGIRRKKGNTALIIASRLSRKCVCSKGREADTLTLPSPSKGEGTPSPCPLPRRERGISTCLCLEGRRSGGVVSAHVTVRACGAGCWRPDGHWLITICVSKAPLPVSWEADERRPRQLHGRPPGLFWDCFVADSSQRPADEPLFCQCPEGRRDV